MHQIRATGPMIPTERLGRADIYKRPRRVRERQARMRRVSSATVITR